MKTMIFFFAISLWAVACFAQTGSTGIINGRVADAANQEGIPFGFVVLYQNNVQKATAQTDFDGYYVIKPVNPGVYDLRIQYTNYQVAVVAGIRVETEKTTLQDIQMIPVVSYEVSGSHHDNCTPSRSTTTQNALAGAGTADTVTTALNITSCRGTTTKYYVDGIPMRCPVSVSISAVDQLRNITGGIPCTYGYSDENSLASCYQYTELLSSRFKLK